MRRTQLLSFTLVALCSPAIAQVFCFPVDEEGFEDAAGWTHQGTQTDVDITAGAMSWSNAHNGVYDRWWRPLNWAVADDCFKVEFTFTVGPNPEGSGSGGTLFALTAGSLDPLTYDLSQAYSPTVQDGLVLMLNSMDPADNDINDWWLEIREKNASNVYAQTGTEAILLDSAISTYHVVFQRLSSTLVELSLYTDAAHMMLHGTSTFGIHSTVTGLNTVQAGVTTAGWSTRQFNGTVDDISICHCENTIAIPESNVTGPAFEIHAITTGQVSIRSNDPDPVRISIMDVQGREILGILMDAHGETRMLSLESGIYFVSTLDAMPRRVQRVVVP